jgi:hypothetical protein
MANSRSESLSLKRNRTRRTFSRGSATYRDADGQFVNRNHTANIPDIVLTPGQWNYVSCVIPAASLDPQRSVDSLALRLHLKSFEIGDVAYVDDIQVYPIADPE